MQQFCGMYIWQIVADNFLQLDLLSDHCRIITDHITKSIAHKAFTPKLSTVLEGPLWYNLLLLYKTFTPELELLKIWTLECNSCKSDNLTAVIYKFSVVPCSNVCNYLSLQSHENGFKLQFHSYTNSGLFVALVM